jgi:hypothetical protein
MADDRSAEPLDFCNRIIKTFRTQKFSLLFELTSLFSSSSSSLHPLPILSNLSATDRVCAAAPKKWAYCNLLQLAAKSVPLFSSLYSLFFSTFTRDFLCFHQLPASFLQNRGWGQVA